MAARTRASTYDPEPRVKSRSDIYTGMLVISLLAMIAGCALLYLDYDQYTSSKPPTLPAAPAITPPAGGGPGGTAIPPAGAGVQPGETQPPTSDHLSAGDSPSRDSKRGSGPKPSQPVETQVSTGWCRLSLDFALHPRWHHQDRDLQSV